MTQQLRNFLLRLTSRKFLAALSVIVACACAVFHPEQIVTMYTVILRIAAMVVMLLAAIGYAFVEASVDKAHRRDGHGEDTTDMDG